MKVSSRKPGLRSPNRKRQVTVPKVRVVLLALVPPLLAAAAALSFSGSVEAQDLIQAVKAGRLDKVEDILEAHPELLDAADPAGYTPLRWAGIRNQGSIAAFLVRGGADPNTVGWDGGTPLHGAAHHDDAAMMKALVAAGGNVTVRNQWGRTPLHVAARRNCLAVAEVLLEAGADLEAPTNEGWTPLSVAYRAGHPRMVELLLSQGANPEARDLEGLKPGDVTLSRPEAVSLTRRQLDPYVGHYDLGDGYGFDVWRAGDEMGLMEFAPDKMFPVALDTFYAVREPWRVVFKRDRDGQISGMDVDFLRRTVTARKIVDPSRGFTYVGSMACLGCHQKGPGSGPAGHWVASRHSRAVHTLSTDQAKAIAAGREEYKDILDPSREQRCLMCHATGAQNPQAQFGPDFLRQEGVGCETCHGPGSDYTDPEIMADRQAFLANGGVIPDWLTCRGCHRDEGFRFMPMWERIRHGG